MEAMCGAWWAHGNVAASNQKLYRSHVALHIYIKRSETYFSRHIIPLIPVYHEVK